MAAKNSSVLKQFVYAASSSTYGDSAKLPKVEGNEGSPLSPYAVTKLVNELYADVFRRVYGFNSIGLRYFNVFGPNQNPNNPYAAVIPIFCKSFISNCSPVVNGDGETSRDFTFIENVVQANIITLLHPNLMISTNHHKKDAQIFNVACGQQISLNEILELLRNISGKDLKATYEKERIGDIKHSMASIEKIKNAFLYNPNFMFNRGLEITYNWYKENFKY